jgi:hypothetical protein
LISRPPRGDIHLFFFFVFVFVFILILTLILISVLIPIIIFREAGTPAYSVDF